MKKKLISLLVLLMAAVSGAWAAEIDLSMLNDNYEAQNGDVLTGSTSDYYVIIAANATVTLDGVTIIKANSDDSCIKCAGNATIILKDGTTNTLTSSSQYAPALWVGDAGTTLTIQGNTGVLNVESGTCCAGIGGGWYNTDKTCGNITIEGGIITAQGGVFAAGIGSDFGTAACGDITITGGTVTATGGIYAAGIGGGYANEGNTHCGDIKIYDTVTKVTAKAGIYAPCSIGKGFANDASATCGTVTIGGKVYANGVSDSPFNYPAPDYVFDVAATDHGSGTVKFYIGGKEVKGAYMADEGETVTVKVTPDEGWTVDEANVTAALLYNNWENAGARRATDGEPANNVPIQDNIALNFVNKENGVWTFTFTQPASSVRVSPKYLKASTLFFNPADKTELMEVKVDGKVANPIQEGKITPVLENTPVNLKANRGYVFRSVEVKKGGELLSFTIGTGTTIYYLEGETWAQAIKNHSTENAKWAVKDSDNCVYFDQEGGTNYGTLRIQNSNELVQKGSAIDATKTYFVDYGI